MALLLPLVETRCQDAAGLISVLGTPVIPIIVCSIPESARETDLCAAVDISVCAGRLAALAEVVMGHDCDWNKQKTCSLARETENFFSSFTCSNR